MKITGKLLLFFVLIPLFSYAQDKEPVIVITDESYQTLDSLSAEVESIVVDTARDKPNLAALYSAVLPGLGQAFNKKYWKLPLVYGGFAFFGYLIKYNHEAYREFNAALYARSDEDPRTEPQPPYDNLSNDVLERGNDFYRRNRDFVIILTAVWYALNIVDAHVDAHLNEFTISEDLSFNIRPSIEQSAYYTRNYGVTLTLNF